MRTLPSIIAAFVCLGLSTSGWTQEIVDDWRYTLRRPANEWRQVNFDDSEWTKGTGGFGTYGTPGARVGTTWATNSIWLRKSFELTSIPANPALLMHHDEDADIYINGKQVGNVAGYTSKYVVIPIDNEERGVLKTGNNTMAVHCKQTTGGQFIDVHLIDAGSVPELPKPKRSTKPFLSELITKWGAEVTPENAWTEYPRPLMRRDNWTNLNGNWDYAVTPIDVQEKPTDWSGKILVPYSLESKLGGVQRLLDASEALWYHRSFRLEEKSAGRSWLLNFEAVDYRCEVIVNGKSVGTHTGGNTPFSLDISDAISEGDNELVVRVEDATEAFQLRGKQVINARGIWYTQVSGIWQTVWLEEAAGDHIDDLKISTSAKEGSITVETKTVSNKTVEVVVKDGETTVATVKGGTTTTLKLDGAKLWTPANPHLYDITVNLLDESGQVVDSVDSYAGIRDVGKVKDADGHWRFTLNGEVVFHWGPLDQGWWPDGLLTPPSDEAMLFDIEWLKSAGFNMIRKHIKVEPRRYYYHCDRLGMMVWQDQVSGGIGRNNGWPAWTRLMPNPVDAMWPPKQHKQFMAELEEMIGSLESHPSIVCWVPFNEAWGQHQTVKVGKWTSRRDPSRLVNVASGGNFWPAGDIVDEHRYPHPGFPFDLNTNGRFDDYIKVMGEFGGHGYPVKGHLWDANRRNWGYGGLPQNEEEYKERYATSLRMLNELRGKGIAAGVYTQTTDVEGEINGLMTYDRKVIKIPAKDLAVLHQVLFTETPQQAAKADQFPREALREVPTNRKPAPVMSAETILAGLESHDKALYIKAGWIRDPYITTGPDDFYYLTGTQPKEGDPREAKNPYNIGLGDASIVGDQVRLWRSKDLINWESLGPIFTVDDTMKAKSGKKIPKRLIWAPEVHWLADKGRWALVHCPGMHSSLAFTEGKELRAPWTHPMNGAMGKRHDPSIFTDDDGKRYLLWANTSIAPLSDDLTGYTAKPVRIDPAGSRPGPDGEPISRIGHEGATMIKVGDKYVHLGTAWSTDQGRKGSYNLYYCVADKITGPYGPRKFAGRFLGHGTPFKDKQGKWWCTAFFNGNVPPVTRAGIQTRDIGDNAKTINEQGVTIVPLDVRMLDNGEVYIRAKDPDYANPGPDEAQKFDDVGQAANLSTSLKTRKQAGSLHYDDLAVSGRWSADRINAWYDAHPWLVGCNYYPATAINQIDMWQASTWDPKQIDKELGWAESIGMNTLRVYLHDLVWADDEEGLYKRMDEFLEICENHGIRPFFVFFDDCHYPKPKLGEQPLPVRAWHNSGWLNCPARDVALRYAHGTATQTEVAQLKGYVQRTMQRFANDERVLAWELYNEPGRGAGNLDGQAKRGAIGDLSRKLVHDSWVWAREVNPSQPITSCTAGSVGEMNKAINYANADMHSIHCYSPPEELEKLIEEYQADGRPILMTEWLARSAGSTVQDCLPVLKRHNVAAINWGLVVGKSQTHYPWSSRKGPNGKRLDVNETRASGHIIRPGEPFPEPKVWFHDLFRMDGTPFDQAEIDTFRELIGIE
ncbi:glycoside hydrolase family 2 [Rhodopirellula sallentina]|uniref:Glycoside hydrolase family 2 sugar binding protein n=1 Tax=Rhodopirellula sallentina SM41 TaxID=1263870 RepID=M5U6H5_9BACT|nr:glycoside hydrolase family 2 [Rhodopirellula sallentina]EMI57072.1 glycoside hydrolase family 2 sugar binding protein [Rhodopirellula sallentina SM41]